MGWMLDMLVVAFAMTGLLVAVAVGVDLRMREGRTNRVRNRPRRWRPPSDRRVRASARER